MNPSKSSERHARWQALIAEQETSGQTQAEFCKDRNLVLSQFIYYRGVARDKKTNEILPSSFKPIHLNKNEINPSKEIRILLPNGFQCFFPMQIETTQIKRIVEILFSC